MMGSWERTQHALRLIRVIVAIKMINYAKMRDCNIRNPTNPMVKRKGSIISKDEERGSKRRLRSGRIIETLISPLRLTKEVVTASTPSNPRFKPFVKPFTSSKSAIKTTRVIDSEDGQDETDDELQPISSHDSQAIVVHKKAPSNETNMNLISVDMSSVEKKGFQGQVLHGKPSISKAKLTRKTARGFVITLSLLLSRN
jgi:hypothetical protein